MPVDQCLHRFEFENGTPFDNRINEIGLSKLVERNFERYLQRHPTDASRELLLVDPLVEKPSEFVVNFKHATHRTIRDSSELALIHAARGAANDNWHFSIPIRITNYVITSRVGYVPPSQNTEALGDRNMGDRKISCPPVIPNPMHNPDTSGQSQTLTKLIPRPTRPAGN
jgi:hypothetical protein